MTSFVSRLVAVAALAMAIAGSAGAQSVVGKGRSSPVPEPVNLDPTELFQEKFVSVGDDLFIGGQPTEKALRELKALGMAYVHIPMRGTPENPYGPKQLDTFAATMAAAQGKVLLHCTIAWRASHLWAAYLIRERHVPVETALAHARMINLREEAPFGAQHPIEGFLERNLPGLARPKP